MRTVLLVLSGVAGLGLAVTGLEVAHPAFFAWEPVVVWTETTDSPPVVSFGAAPWTPDWEGYPEEGRVRWEGVLPPHAPLGVWVVCAGEACHAFLRVGEGQGILEIETMPGAVLTLGGETRVADGSGRAFFVMPPGDYEFRAAAEGATVAGIGRIRAGQRARVSLALASTDVSTPTALPGATVTVSVRVGSPRELPIFSADLVVPEGWEVHPEPGLHDPLRAGEAAVRSWRVEIPAEGELGEYVLIVVLPDVGITLRSGLTVADRLPPQLVICHWDVDQDELDLSVPCEVTYARLLWAVAFVGRELPYAGRTLTRTEVEALAAEWQEDR